MIAGTGSGCGKTTITCSILSGLREKNIKATAFKSGPDYIDPMFHSQIIDTPSQNLDPFFFDKNTLKYLLAEDSKGYEVSIIEGAMGLYDGADFSEDIYSANCLSNDTETDVILVLNVKGKARSLAAEAKGYLAFGNNRIKGFILNNCSEGMYSIYNELLFKETGVRCYGYMPHSEDAVIPSRHLGLFTAYEIEDIKERIKRLGNIALETIQIDEIVELANTAENISYENIYIPKVERVRIAVAFDEAFNFYYEDNFRLLKRMGAELVYFSPVKDEKMPEAEGLMIGGGYPEIHIEKLSSNGKMKNSIKQAVKNGMPVFAECGGFMYLGDTISVEGKTYETVGAIKGNSKMSDKLVRFGYKTLTANDDNMLCKRGMRIKAHEFHYSETDTYGNGFTASSMRGRKWQTAFAKNRIYAGYPHIHFWSDPSIALNFLSACRNFADELKSKE